MSRELLVLRWCDNCAIDDEKTEATVERTVSIDGDKPVTIDLCEGCDDAVVAPLVAVLDEGTVVSPDRVDEYRRTCQDCGLVSQSRAALGQHTKTQHGKGLRDYDWA